MGEKIARKLTGAMASWSFAGLFLLGCIFEIWWNHSNLVPNGFKFDPQTILLNLILSLIAAIQGSIIMIAQKQADKDRDGMMQLMIRLEKRLLKEEKAQTIKEDLILEELREIKEKLGIEAK